ncbi:hypothetical protein FRB97_004370 [Tulasnella sp. 331]|nr:hypothetical protein FRB97_004370 [Tulasnella sp. 331]
MFTVAGLEVPGLLGRLDLAVPLLELPEHALVTEMKAVEATIKDQDGRSMVARSESNKAAFALNPVNVTSTDNKRSKMLLSRILKHKKMRRARIDMARHHAAKGEGLEVAAGGDVQSELSGKDLSIASSKSQLKCFQTLRQVAAVINNDQAHETDVIITHQEAERSLREELADSNKGPAKTKVDAAVAVDTINAPQHEKASLRAQPDGVIGENVGLRFDVRLGAVRKAGLVVQEDIVRRLSGEIGCVETDILQNMPDPLDGEKTGCSSDPLTPGKDDDKIIDMDPLPEVVVPGELPAAFSMKAHDSRPYVIDVPFI